MYDLWLDGYTQGAFLVQNAVKTNGWARAKGEIKTAITYRIERAMQFGMNDPFINGMADATLDSVN